MSKDHTKEYLLGLLKELLALPKETEWLEFKHDFVDPVAIGEYISALANSAAICNKTNGYAIWGVEDENHEILGTNFMPNKFKKGNEELESWLLRLLKPKIHFNFYTLNTEGKDVVILEIPRATHTPVQFEGVEYIRVGSYKKKLKDYPERERELWRIFDNIPFEEQIALEHVSSENVLRMIDYPSYFELLDMDLPENREAILDRLLNDNMIQLCRAGGWEITNLGAILFAKNINDFKHLKRKAVRVIEYDGNNRIKTKKEHVGKMGYASGYNGLISFINNLLPSNEVIEQAIRKDVPIYPELAIRELVVNAIIHQDFSMTGTGPLVEIFNDRMEITNPGKPLVDTLRFLDTPPRSRNETLASFLRRIGICEERGSGIDKVVFQTEFYQLPAPIFEVVDGHTRSVLFAHKPLNKMVKDERIRACYLHACLKYVSREMMTNSSIRVRFGIDEKNSAKASRIIKEALQSGEIRFYDPGMSRKHAKYLPYWA